jgi:beta-glucanase (GH16 family)
MTPITTKTHSTAMPIVAVLLLALSCISISQVSCANRNPGDTTDALSPQRGTVTPALFQDFSPGWTNNTSQDGLWKINGIWVGTGKNTFYPANVTFTDTYPGERTKGFMYFKSEANAIKGSEIQTLSSGPFYGYGYYEVRMKVTGVGDPATNRGVCASFFWKRKNYAAAEWDLEFLTNEKWITSPDSGEVTMNYHLNDGRSKVHRQKLPFNPSKGFHRYGFLWQPTRLDWTVDGKIVYSFDDPGVASEPGYIMMNSWTGNKNWGGLSPTEDAVTVYDWVKFYPNVTSVPNDGKE